MTRRRVHTPPGVSLLRSVAEREGLVRALRERGLVLVLEPKARWWEAYIYIDLPVVPAEHRQLGAGYGRTYREALAYLRACCAEVRVALSPEWFAATTTWRERLETECRRAAEALGDLGIEMPSEEAA